MLGIEGTEKVSVQTPSSAIVLTEAINLAAKEYDSKCYWLKPAMIVASWKLGADFGIGEDNAYYLGTPTVGVASFHDPGDEVGYLVLKVIKEQIPVWGSPWSGLIRQDDAYEILKDFYAENSLVEQYAEATSTEEMQVIREKYFNTKRTATALEISKLMSDKTD